MTMSNALLEPDKPVCGSCEYLSNGLTGHRYGLTTNMGEARDRSCFVAPLRTLRPLWGGVGMKPSSEACESTLAETTFV
jgi:hypothetical protein